jgi:hypothetical protein
MRNGVGFPVGSCQCSRGGTGRRFRGDVGASWSDEVGTGVRWGISWGAMGYIMGCEEWV